MKRKMEGEGGKRLERAQSTKIGESKRKNNMVQAKVLARTNRSVSSFFHQQAVFIRARMTDTKYLTSLVGKRQGRRRGRAGNGYVNYSSMVLRSLALMAVILLRKSSSSSSSSSMVILLVEGVEGY